MTVGRQLSFLELCCVFIFANKVPCNIRNSLGLFLQRLVKHGGHGEVLRLLGGLLLCDLSLGHLSRCLNITHLVEKGVFEINFDFIRLHLLLQGFCKSKHI